MEVGEGHVQVVVVQEAVCLVFSPYMVKTRSAKQSSITLITYLTNKSSHMIFSQLNNFEGTEVLRKHLSNYKNVESIFQIQNSIRFSLIKG